MIDTSAGELFRRNLLFRDLPDEAINELAALSVRRTFDKDELIFSEGDAGDALYGVVSGSVKMVSSNKEGKAIVLNLMERGDIFGEISVMDGQPRTASAQVVARANLLVVYRMKFLQLVEQESVLAVHLLKLLCRRLRWTTDIVNESILLAAPERIAKRLLRLAESYGRKTDQGDELLMSQADLASFLGVSRQIVNQYLQEWKDSGLIDLGRAKIIVRDAPALASIEG